KDCPARYRALSMRIRREPITQTVNGLKTPGADPIARLPLSRPTHLRHRPLFSVVCGQRPELPPTTSLRNVLANGTSPAFRCVFRGFSSVYQLTWPFPYPPERRTWPRPLQLPGLARYASPPSCSTTLSLLPTRSDVATPTSSTA